jgi:hypothetical protein
VLRNGVLEAICSDEMPQTTSVDNKWQESTVKYPSYSGQKLLSEKSKAIYNFFYPLTVIDIEVLLHLMCV